MKSSEILIKPNKPLFPLKNCFLFLGFILFFCFVFKIDIGLISPFRLSLASICFLGMWIISTGKVEKIYITYNLIAFLPVLFSFFIYIIHGFVDFSFTKYTINTFIVNGSVIYLFLMFFRSMGKYSNIHVIYKLMYAFFIVQIVISIFFVVFPDIGSNFFLNIERQGVFMENVIRGGAVRLFGIGSFKTGSVAPFLGGFSLFSYFYFYSKNKRVWALIFAFMAIILGTFFARTTILAIFPLYFMIIATGKTLTKKMVQNIMFLCFGVFLGLFIFYNKDILLFRWAFEPFVNYFERGSFSSASVDALKKMINFPDNTMTYLIGEGRFFEIDAASNLTGYYRGIDIGYLRIFYYGGFLMLLLYYIPFIWMLYLFLKTPYIERSIKVLYVSLFMLFVLCMLKGIALPDFYLILLFYLFFSKHSKKRQN